MKSHPLERQFKSKTFEPTQDVVSSQGAESMNNANKAVRQASPGDMIRVMPPDSLGPWKLADTCDVLGPKFSDSLLQIWLEDEQDRLLKAKEASALSYPSGMPPRINERIEQIKASNEYLAINTCKQIGPSTSRKARVLFKGTVSSKLVCVTQTSSQPRTEESCVVWREEQPCVSLVLFFTPC